MDALDDVECADVADAALHPEHAEPRSFVLWIREHLAECEHILDVRALEEPDAAAVVVRNITLHEFHFEELGEVRGAEQYRNLGERHATVTEFKNALRDVAGLIFHGVRLNEEI